MKISIIVPAYNEQNFIGECLQSLINQSWEDVEIIIIDDGSTDDTIKVVKCFQQRQTRVKLLTQAHLGPAVARNTGAKIASGEILVFVDADMTFDSDFIKMLVKPIIENKSIGTFSKMEYLSNQKNVWSRCWNINKNLPDIKMHPDNYPDHQKVFRAIKKNEFERSGGFTPLGYIDDYTISEKLGKEAINAEGAIFYHHNPSSLSEVFTQAMWVGTSEYKRRKIENEQLMRFLSLIRYLPVFSLMTGLKKSFKHRLPAFLLFKLVYDFAIELSLLRSFISNVIFK